MKKVITFSLCLILILSCGCRKIEREQITSSEAPSATDYDDSNIYIEYSKPSFTAIDFNLSSFDTLVSDDINSDITVYITDTGAKYHKISCPSLYNSCYSITLSDAIAAGYTSCSRCNPP